MKGKITGILLIFMSLCFASVNVHGQEVNKVMSAEPAEENSTIFEDYLKGYYSQVFGVDITNILNVDLYNSIEKWLGTPYRYAGKSIEGIDCSSFVNKIYETAYCYLLTGNSADLFKKVTLLPKDKLQEGDLVFFKINRKSISHVGVYLGGDKFAHASRSKGVIISDLNHPYYKKYFVKGGRVNFHTN
ncbi:MAG TPA: C40 family peptidase [Bacteroidia bacterium]|nr:C40 family peptidase [Bacteroidia bacterium]